MNALFYRYGSICEPDVIEAFLVLGVTVDELTEEVSNKGLTPQECIESVSHHLLEHPADFVFSINFFPAVSEVCNIFHLPYLCWVVDSPVMELYTSSIANPWNRVFIFDSLLAEEIRRFNPEHVWYMPLASNITGKQELIRQTKTSVRRSFASPVAFVGSLYTEKCPYDRLLDPPPYLRGYLEGLMEAQLRIYGCYFVEDILPESVIQEFTRHLPGFFRLPGDNFLTDRITMAELYLGAKISVMERDRIMKLLSPLFPVSIYTGSDTSAYPALKNCGLAKTLTEMPLIFHESTVNLNITAKSIRNGLPLRIWDILASEGFCLTNFQNDLAGLLTPGEHLETYGSFEELEEKVRFYLEHKETAADIAHAGLEEVKRHHTYPLRLVNMLELALKS